MRHKPGEVGRLIGGRVDVTRAGQTVDHADHGSAEQDLQVVPLAVLGQRHLAAAVDQLAADPGPPDPAEGDVRSPSASCGQLHRGVGLEIVAGERQLPGARVLEVLVDHSEAERQVHLLGARLDERLALGIDGDEVLLGDHPARGAAALLELQLVIALDRIEGVGGRQQLESAPRTLIWRAMPKPCTSSVSSVTSRSAALSPIRSHSVGPGLEGNGTLIEPTVDEAREARAHGEDPVVGDRLDRSDAREAVVRLQGRGAVCGEGADRRVVRGLARSDRAGLDHLVDAVLVAG